MALVKIDPEFEALIPKLTDEEYAQLEKNILREGCRDLLRFWVGPVVGGGRDSLLLDGHNRYRICEKHGLSFGQTPIALDSREEALLWIEQNQLGRRNLTDDQRIIIAGRVAERKAEISRKIRAQEAANTREKKRKGDLGVETSPEIKTPKERAAVAAAREAKVSVHKVKAAQRLEKTPEGKALADKVLNGEMPLAKAVREAAFEVVPEVTHHVPNVRRLLRLLSTIKTAVKMIDESGEQLFAHEGVADIFLEGAKNLRCTLDGLIAQVERERKTTLENAVVVGEVI